MGSNVLVEATQTKNNADILEETFPYYLAIGMSSSEYWNGDPVLAKYYREAHKLKQEQENEKMWLQGMYFYDALSTALHNVMKPKNAQAKHYPDKPYNFNNKEKTEAEKVKEVEIEQEKAFAWMENFVRINSKKSQSREPEPQKR